MKKAKKGFTLVELMVVIVIMAVLAAAATPVFWKTEGTEPPVRRSSFMVKAQTGSLIPWTGHIQKHKLWRGA